MLARLDTLQMAQEATGLFILLGHDPVVVEFPGITFDIFLKEAHVPTGAWIITESDRNYSVKHIKPPSQYEDEEPVEIPIQ